MSSSYLTNRLTNSQKDFCAYAGVFGILLSLTCLIQHLVIFKSHWITTSLAIFYLLAITSFLLLSLQKPIAGIFLIISAVCSLLVEVLLLNGGLFSLTVLLLFLYHVIIVVLLYMGEIPKRLQLQAEQERKEQEEWNGKI